MTSVSYMEETELPPSVSENSTDFIMDKISQYNLKSFNYKLNGLILRSCTADSKFDDNHRIQTKVYDDNYGFYQTQGILARFQVKKKFLGIGYWKNTSTDQMVVGFNHCKAAYTINPPIPPYGKQYPFSSQARASVIAKISKYTVNLGLSNLIKSPILTDFFYDQVPHWITDLTKLSMETSSELSKYTFRQLTTVVRNQSQKKLNTLLNATLPNNAPQLVNYMFDGSKINFCIVGERDFGKKEEAKIVFNSSGGGSIKYGIDSGSFALLPFCPTGFSLSEIDVYCAAKYKNRWLGVRLYGYQK